MTGASPTVFTKFGLSSNLVACRAMAQVSEECNAGLELQEDMNYSAARLLQVFPSHFTHAQAIALQHQPRAIADQAYGGRNGSRPLPSDDGWIAEGSASHN